MVGSEAIGAMRTINVVALRDMMGWVKEPPDKEKNARQQRGREQARDGGGS